MNWVKYIVEGSLETSHIVLVSRSLRLNWFIYIRIICAKWPCSKNCHCAHYSPWVQHFESRLQKGFVIKATACVSSVRTVWNWRRKYKSAREQILVPVRQKMYRNSMWRLVATYRIFRGATVAHIEVEILLPTYCFSSWPEIPSEVSTWYEGSFALVYSKGRTAYSRML